MRRALEPEPQIIVREHSAGQDDDRYAPLEQRLAVLPHGFVCGRFHDDIGTLRNERVEIGHESDAIFLGERPASRIAAAPRDGNDLRVTEVAATDVLEKEARYRAAAQEGYSHVKLRVNFKSRNE